MSGSKPLVLFFNPIDHAHGFLTKLQEVARTEVVTSKSREEWFKDLEGKYKDVYVIYRTTTSGEIAGNFDADFIEHLPPTCKFICHNGAGYDQIDTTACAAKGISVTNAPDPVTDSTADLAIWLLLGSLRRLNPGLETLRAGKFKQGVPFGRDPQGKTLGILGMGRIGRAIKARCDPLGVTTQYHNRSQLSPELAAGANYVSFEALLTTSDILLIAIPLNAKTRHLIGAAEIARMKDEVVIVNIARGAIIDEAAMAEALDAGKIASVGLDVYEHEPLVNERLLRNSRALLVPHMGTHSIETLTKMEECAMENARRAVMQEALLSEVPETK